MSKPKKRFLVLCIIATILAPWAYFSLPAETDTTSGLEVTFVDVGQGDCVFIKEPSGRTMLVDVGEADEFDARLRPFLNSKDVRSIDSLVVTHYHNDHIGAAKNVFGSLDVAKLFAPDYTPGSKAKSQLFKLAEMEGSLILDISEGDILPSDDPNLHISVLHPLQNGFSDKENDNSLVLRLEYFDTTILLTGDIEEPAEKEVLEKYDIETDILKVAHHGSSTSTCAEFLQAADPTYAIIQCGADNSYGHPHFETISALEDDDVLVFRTDLEGSISFFITPDGIKSIQTAQK